MFDPLPVLCLVFLGIASWQDIKEREISDFTWIMSIPTAIAIYALSSRDFMQLIPGAVIVIAAYLMARTGLMGEADPLGIALVVLSFSWPVAGIPAYFPVFILSLLCELGAFASLVWKKDNTGAPAAFTYRVKKDQLGLVWLPRLDDGNYAFDLRDPRSMKELIDEAKKRIPGESVWASPALPYMPFLLAAAAVFLVVAWG
ncbi:MAG: prepilin peptidase [Thermoprotei archaeon]